MRCVALMHIIPTFSEAKTTPFSNLMSGKSLGINEQSPKNYDEIAQFLLIFYEKITFNGCLWHISTGKLRLLVEERKFEVHILLREDTTKYFCFVLSQWRNCSRSTKRGKQVIRSKLYEPFSPNIKASIPQYLFDDLL